MNFFNGIPRNCIFFIITKPNYIDPESEAAEEIYRQQFKDFSDRLKSMSLEQRAAERAKDLGISVEDALTIERMKKQNNAHLGLLGGSPGVPRLPVAKVEKHHTPPGAPKCFGLYLICGLLQDVAQPRPHCLNNYNTSR